VKIQSETLDTVGVFARSIEHCEAWLAAMGRHQEHAAQLHDGNAIPPRITVVTNLLPQATREMQKAVRDAAGVLANAGYHVHERLLPPPLAALHECQDVIQQYECSRAYALDYGQDGGRLTTALAEALAAGKRIPAFTYEQALKVTGEARQVAAILLDRQEIWLLPAAAGAAPTGLSSTGDPIFNRLASLLHLPSVCIPGAADANRLPLGLQLVGGLGQDSHLLRHTARIASLVKGC